MRCDKLRLVHHKLLILIDMPTGLTQVQVDHLKQEIRKAKDRGASAHQCKKCKSMSAYVYKNFEKRGGTKYLYGCEKCLNHWSDLVVSEEDYDFLSN